MRLLVALVSPFNVTIQTTTDGIAPMSSSNIRFYLYARRSRSIIFSRLSEEASKSVLSAQQRIYVYIIDLYRDASRP